MTTANVLFPALRPGLLVQREDVEGFGVRRIWIGYRNAARSADGDVLFPAFAEKCYGSCDRIIIELGFPEQPSGFRIVRVEPLVACGADEQQAGRSRDRAADIDASRVTLRFRQLICNPK